MVKNSPANAGDASLNPESGWSPREESGNQLQYSYWEVPLDRGAWQATVQGIARVRHNLVTEQQSTIICMWIASCVLSSTISFREQCFQLAILPFALIPISIISMCMCSVISDSCDLMKCSPPGSSVHGISQIRILEWFDIPFSRESFQSRTEHGAPALQAGA